jgi:hypothetical protein
MSIGGGRKKKTGKCLQRGSQQGEPRGDKTADARGQQTGEGSRGGKAAMRRRNCLRGGITLVPSPLDTRVQQKRRVSSIYSLQRHLFDLILKIYAAASIARCAFFSKRIQHIFLDLSPHINTNTEGLV